jgi:hypothetical protein
MREARISPRPDQHNRRIAFPGHHELVSRIVTSYR